MQPLIIGIAGGTGCGKTTIAQNICQNLEEKKVILLSQDSYYIDLSHMPLSERKKFNFDHPTAFDNALLYQHLNHLSHGQKIEMPLYSFIDYTRKNETKTVYPAEIIILEGLLVLEEKTLRDILDIKIYVDTDSDERFIRRVLRDTRERGRTLDSIVEQYLNRVKPMFLQFVEPSKRYADIIIPQGGMNKVAIDLVVSKIKNRMGQ